MPHWAIYHTPSTGTLAKPEARQALARDITTIYTGVGLPAFYVVVMYHALEPSELFVGGEPNDGSHKPFVRLTFEHTARAFGSNDAKMQFLAKASPGLDSILKSHLLDQGFDFEYSGVDSDRDLWRINSMVPPQEGTRAFEAWKRENRAVPLENL